MSKPAIHTLRDLEPDAAMIKSSIVGYKSLGSDCRGFGFRPWVSLRHSNTEQSGIAVSGNLAIKAPKKKRRPKRRMIFLPMLQQHRHEQRLKPPRPRCPNASLHAPFRSVKLVVKDGLASFCHHMPEPGLPSPGIVAHPPQDYLLPLLLRTGEQVYH
jgi:hypothetical protein